MLWLLQSAFKDLKTTPQSPAFPLCQRVYNRVQAIIFNTEVGEEAEVVAFTKAMPVKENVIPALVGIGMIIASIASPSATIASKEIVLSLGRKGRSYSFESIPSVRSPEPSSTPLPVPAITNLVKNTNSMKKSNSMKALALISSSSPTIDGMYFAI
jgi:hypothetical protein